MQQVREPQLSCSLCRSIHTHQVRQRGTPALYLALRLLVRGLFQPTPFLHHLVTFGDFIDCMGRSDFRQPASSFGLPSLLAPDGSAPPATAGSPMFRYKPFVRELALDPGGASPSRIATVHMLPS